ncbi:hypothetical protein GCM10010123_08840 [Pilimelia anulata]|uniref:SCO6045-like C-terminal domain-containing protein n=1 Tax=Pilimelia anulata TaxID=53371 RepID=A0A8J3B053_9ACTN|nr:hypothetical protein [Pilimelia anulata]GGJ81274.1 hypothetical protein GCM10010123_08840 [Pilimelia anulata]
MTPPTPPEPVADLLDADPMDAEPPGLPDAGSVDAGSANMGPAGTGPADTGWADAGADVGLVGSGLAARQAALVAALTGTGPDPAGFDPARLAAARAALLAKRAGEVAHAWPALARECGADWRATFAAWAAGRAPAGGYADGLALARHRLAAGALGPAAAAELALALAHARRGPIGVGRAGRALALRLGPHSRLLRP